MTICVLTVSFQPPRMTLQKFRRLCPGASAWQLGSVWPANAFISSVPPTFSRSDTNVANNGQTKTTLESKNVRTRASPGRASYQLSGTELKRAALRPGTIQRADPRQPSSVTLFSLQPAHCISRFGARRQRIFIRRAFRA